MKRKDVKQKYSYLSPKVIKFLHNHFTFNFLLTNFDEMNFLYLSFHWNNKIVMTRDEQDDKGLPNESIHIIDYISVKILCSIIFDSMSISIWSSRIFVNSLWWFSVELNRIIEFEYLDLFSKTIMIIFPIIIHFHN